MQLVSLAATVTNLQKAVQEAEDHGDCREQRPEGVLRRRPAVRVDRPRLVLRVQIAGFFGKVAVRLGPNIWILN